MPFDVLTMGRVGVDVYPLQTGVGPAEVTSFGKYPGGSPTNVAVAAARYGHGSAAITKTGRDPFGDFVRTALEDYGVDARFVGTSDIAPTPVTFCEIFPPDDFPLYFYRLPKAPDLDLHADELDLAAVGDARIFWVTGTGLSEEPSRSATPAALAHRAKAGATVFDLDWRPMFWTEPDQARAYYAQALRHTTVAVGNLDECEVATGEREPNAAAQALLAAGVELAVVKQGPKGVLAMGRGRLRLLGQGPQTAHRAGSGRGPLPALPRGRRRRRRRGPSGEPAVNDTAKYHLPRGTAADGPYGLLVTPESAGWEYSGLRILTLKPGEAHTLSTGESEFLVLPLTGGCTVTVDGQSFELGGRTGVFASVTDFAHLPRESEALTGRVFGGRFALPSARTERSSLSARYGPQQNVPVELRGAGNCSRQVNNYCPPGTFEAEHLLVCEVLTPGGNWSSYPPHKHDQARPGAESELEEIYHFQVAGENVFGYLGVPPRERSRAWGSVYGTPERPIDVLAEVRSGDTVLIPHGRQGPSVAAPGYDLYYLNVMAGPGQDRAWLICDDPAHGWVRTTWDARVTTGMDAYKEELFGPVLAVLRVDTLDRAIDLINANPYGNGTALFTASIGDSPIHGPEGIRFYTRPKVVTTRRPQPAQQVAAGFNFPTSS